jgi:hypothetical protein
MQLCHISQNGEDHRLQSPYEPRGKANTLAGGSREASGSEKEDEGAAA